ncbi:MAG: dienelactone hydrolase family protein [Pseudomonadota bacterium]
MSQASDSTLMVTCDGGTMGGYLALPPGGSGPGIVLLQEIFGVNAAIRAKCDRLAAEGFVVFAPDMFWRLEPNVDLGYSEPERQQGFGYLTAFDQTKGAKDIQAAWRALADHPACTASPAIVGFCIGGRMAIRAGSALPEASGVFAFYGVKLDEIADEAASIDVPLRLYFGDQDSHVPLDIAKSLTNLLADKPNAEVHIYEGAGHGFYNPVREAVYNEAAATSAHANMIATLKGQGT